MSNVDLKNPSRRDFLRAVPAGAAAGFMVANASLLLAPSAAAQERTAPNGASYQLFTAEQIRDDVKALEASPGDRNLVVEKTFKVALTVETAKSAKEFEWHEGRDHVLIVLEGETVYQVGGTPKGAHSIGPGEWHAPESDGTTTLTLRKDDLLAIPRGTPHKRSTAGTVTFYLISPQGT